MPYRLEDMTVAEIAALYQEKKEHLAFELDRLEMLRSQFVEQMVGGQVPPPIIRRGPGRPPKIFDRLTVHVPPDLKHRLKQESLDRGMTIGEIVTEVFEERHARGW